MAEDHVEAVSEEDLAEVDSVDLADLITDRRIIAEGGFSDRDTTAEAAASADLWE